MTDLEKAIENVPKVFEAGRESFYDDFWDKYQDETLSNFNYAFAGSSWNDETFVPKKDIVLPQYGGQCIFYQSHITDLEGVLKNRGLILDLSACANLKQTFAASLITAIPEIEISPSFSGNIGGIFESCTKLKSIRKIKWSGTRAHLSTIYNCTSLEYLQIDGAINRTLTIQYSPLTVESAISIITHLVDYSGTEKEYVYTVNFSDTTKALLEAEGNTAPNGDTWLNYIGTLGWTI